MSTKSYFIGYFVWTSSKSTVDLTTIRCVELTVKFCFSKLDTKKLGQQMGCQGVPLFPITSADASSPTVQIHKEKHSHQLHNLKLIVLFLCLIKGALPSYKDHSF